jgi:hypothetical protein
MGRLTLNILLSFAQFERELIGERIRDKFAASRKRGMWMGGVVPLGYDVRDRKLWINEAEAATVRMIFHEFIALGSAIALVRELKQKDIRNRQGKQIDKCFLYRLLNNRIYLGEAVHKGEAYKGEHEPIIDADTWRKVHAILKEPPRLRAARTRAQTPALLKGLIYGPDGRALSPSHTRKRGRLYRYYVSQTVTKGGACGAAWARVPAGDLETAVVDQLRDLLRTPEMIIGAWRAARHDAPDLTEREARDALVRLDPLWNELFPAEQARIIQLLIERVDIAADGVRIKIRKEGLDGLTEELSAIAAAPHPGRKAA